MYIQACFLSSNALKEKQAFPSFINGINKTSDFCVGWTLLIKMDFMTTQKYLR